jgi:hypothetical protein
MEDREITTVDVVWKEGWRYVGQIVRERGSWCWWVHKYPARELVASGELVKEGWAESEQDARAAVERVMGEVDP